MLIRIVIKNPLECEIPKKFHKLIEPAIAFKAEYWRKTFRGSKEKIIYDKKCWIHKDKDVCTFYRGHLPVVVKHLKKNHPQYPIKLIKEDTLTPLIKPVWPPDLGEYEKRDYQIKMLRKAFTSYRGVFVAPTGIGKTVLQIGIISCYPEDRVLILAHTVDIVQQTTEKLREAGYEVDMLGGGVKFNPKSKNKILVSTMQSFQKLSEKDKVFSVVIVDEAHHISKFEGGYAKILGSMLAPVRLGFTASMFKEGTEQYMAVTAFLGAPIQRMTIQEAADKKILAKPELRFMRVPGNHTIPKSTRYQSVIERGIIYNEDRNRMIVEKAMSEYAAGKVILIFVTRIEHGTTIQAEFREQGKIVPFVQGSMKAAERMRIKKEMIAKKTRIVLATVTWKEGIDIPSITCVINATFGKSEVATIQSVGRGLRKVKGKESVTIWDIFDNSHHYLINHFGERLMVYMDNDWI